MSLRDFLKIMFSQKIRVKYELILYYIYNHQDDTLSLTLTVI